MFYSKFGWFPFAATIGFCIGVAHAAPVIDQDQPLLGAVIHDFSNENAQSFKQVGDNISGAGVYLDLGTSSETLTIKLYTDLPSNSGTLLASGSVSDTVSGFFDVFWSPVAITPETTYFLVLEATDPANILGVNWGGSGPDGYPRGQAYFGTNWGFTSIAYDYGFRTYADDAFNAAAPEPVSLALVGLGLAGLGIARRRRR